MSLSSLARPQRPVAFSCGTGVRVAETGGAEVQGGGPRRNRHPTGDLFPRVMVVSWNRQTVARLWRVGDVLGECSVDE